MSVIRKISIHDSTLRDGNHAFRHGLTPGHVKAHCALAELAGISAVEVGHGNGLGASSFQVGFSKYPNEEILSVAKENLKKSQLAVHVMPGFAVFERDIRPALEMGVTVFRVGVHCTEADISKNFINKIREHGATAIGCLMMSHMVDNERLGEEARKIVSYGAAGVSIYDSAGAFKPSRVAALIKLLSSEIEGYIGFHCHDNLGLASANVLAAVEAGSNLIDASICGFGAGAGNAKLETIAALLDSEGYETGLDLGRIFDLAKYAGSSYAKIKPFASPASIVSSIAGVFSGFAPHVEKAASTYNVDPLVLFQALGEKGVVGGQEDLIYATASGLSTPPDTNAVNPVGMRELTIPSLQVKSNPKLITPDILEERGRFSDYSRELKAHPVSSGPLDLDSAYHLAAIDTERRGLAYFDSSRVYGYGGYEYNRAYWIALAKDLVGIYQLRPGDWLLDVGCAKGFLLEAISEVCPGLNFFGIDISDYALSKSNKGLDGYLLNFSATKIPFPNSFFNLCVAIDLLQEIKKEEISTILKEINRVSKRCFISLPAATTENHLDKSNFLKWSINAEVVYTREEWIQILKQNRYYGDFQVNILNISVRDSSKIEFTT